MYSINDDVPVEVDSKYYCMCIPNYEIRKDKAIDDFFVQLATDSLSPKNIRSLLGTGCDRYVYFLIYDCSNQAVMDSFFVKYGHLINNWARRSTYVFTYYSKEILDKMAKNKLVCKELLYRQNFDKDQSFSQSKIMNRLKNVCMIQNTPALVVVDLETPQDKEEAEYRIVDLSKIETPEEIRDKIQYVFDYMTENFEGLDTLLGSIKQKTGTREAVIYQAFNDIYKKYAKEKKKTLLEIAQNVGFGCEKSLTRRRDCDGKNFSRNEILLICAYLRVDDITLINNFLCALNYSPLNFEKKNDLLVWQGIQNKENFVNIKMQGNFIDEKGKIKAGI